VSAVRSKFAIKNQKTLQQFAVHVKLLQRLCFISLAKVNTLKTRANKELVRTINDNL